MSADSLVGTRVREYEITELIGRGGMGTVYKARHIYLHKERAIKVIRNIFAEDPHLTERFIREAKILSELDHPNLVRLHEFGQLDQNTYFMVQEYVHGESIYHVMKRLGTIPLHDSLRMIRQAASGLGSAHKKSIVHRDISPDNLMLTKNESGEEIVKVIDFGIAKPLMESGPQFTATRAFVGKPEYCSPEQTGILENTGEIDHRTDIYSLAVTLYYMLIGKLPFHAPTPVGYLIKHASEPPTPLLAHEFAGHIPPALDRLILKALAKNPAERHQTMEALINELDQVSSQPDDFLALFESGKQMYDRQQWQDAIAYWNRALRISPDDENLKQWIKTAEGHRGTILKPHDVSRISTASPPLHVSHPSAATRPATKRSPSPIYLVFGIAAFLILVAASLFVWKSMSRSPQFELIDVAVLPAETGSIENPARIETGKTYKVLLTKDQQYFFKVALEPGHYRLVEDTRRADLIRRNLISTLTLRHPRRSESETVFNFNEIDTNFRGTHSFSLTAPAELDFTLKNMNDDADFFLTLQEGDDTRMVPFMAETLPAPLKLDERATGLLSKNASVYYAIELQKGEYLAEWDVATTQNRKSNLMGYLALLDSDGGNQHQIIDMNEYDMTSKKSASITIRKESPIILRLENYHDDVDYALQIKRAN